MQKVLQRPHYLTDEYVGDSHRENARSRAVASVGAIQVGGKIAQISEHSKNVQVEGERVHVPGSKEYGCNAGK